VASLVVGAAAAMTVGGVANAHDDGAARGKPYRANLNPVPHFYKVDNGSNVQAVSRLRLFADRQLRVRLRATGLDALPHAIHIHGAAQARSECPTREARNDRVADGLIDVVEGLPDYGPILKSFTTRGDTSPASALALDRFPVANVMERLRYKRTMMVTKAIARNLGDLHIVIHGEDLNDNGRYDGRDGSLGAGVPLEAELPVACGVINRVR
jgi:hypothetical protein